MRAQWLCVLVLLAPCLSSGLNAITAYADETPAADDAAALRDYFSGNGLLKRGLYDLAAAEYRKFLDGHGNHAKAPAARYGLAVCMYRLGQLDDAARELTALAAVPGFEFAPDVTVLLSQCHLAKGQYTTAAEELSHLLKEQPNQALAADATALLVEAQYRAGKYDAALEQAGAFLKQWPQNAARERVSLVWGLTLMARQEWPAAASRFAELLRSSPTGPPAEQAELLLAQCQEQRGALDDAQRSYQAIAARKDGRYVPDAQLALAAIALRKDAPADAVPLLEQMLKTAPEGPQRCQGVLLRARAAMALDRPDEARELLRGAETHCEAAGDQFAYWLAKTELRKGEYAAAAESLARASAKYPQSALQAEMGYDRAVALAQKGDDAAAAQAAEQFLAQYAKHELEPDALYLLATLEQRRKNYEHSGELCRTLLERFSQHRLAAAATFLAAENLLLSGKDADAAGAYQQFLTHYPKDPQSAAAALRLGTALYRLGRLDDALGPLRTAAEQADRLPQLRESLLSLGDLYLQRSDWKSAEMWLAKYVERADAPAADEALLKLAVARERQGQMEEALPALERLLSDHAQSTHREHALFERGQVLLSLGRIDQAEAALAQVVKEDTDGRFKPYALIHLGAIALQKKDYPTAAQRFAEAATSATDDATVAAALLQQGQALLAAEQYAEAEKVLAGFIERFPDHAQGVTAQARLAVALARQDKAAEALRAIERVERSSGTLDEALRSDLRYEKAWCLRKTGKTDDAVAAYRAALADSSGPQRAYASVELAELLAAAGKCKEALPLLEPLHKSADEFAKLPDDVRVRALYRIGTCAFEAGDFAGAVAALEQMPAAVTPPGLSASAHYFCGEALFKLRRFEPAVEQLTRVVTEFKHDDAYGPSLLRLGECLAALERWPKSEEVFSQCLRELPSSEQWYQAQFGLGWACENLGRHDDAIAAYRKVVDKHQGPTAARAQFQIGECLYAKKKYADAVTELLKVEILYGQVEWSAAALYEAGRCLEELGQTAEARRQFQTVREKYGQTHWAELAAQRLAAAASSAPPGKGGP